MTYFLKLTGVLKHWHKTFVAFAYDIFMAAAAFYMSFEVRYGELIVKSAPGDLIFKSVLIVVVVQGFCFYVSGLYRGIWRYSSTPDLVRVIRGVSIAVTASFGALFLFNRLEGIPRSLFIIDWTFLVIALGGGRFLYRIMRDRDVQRLTLTGHRVLIVGAGSGGEQLLREIKKNPTLGLNVIGFVDDDPGKKNKYLLGTPVLGSVNQLSDIVSKTVAEKIFIAIPSANSAQIRRIVDICKHAEVEFKTLPRMGDIIRGETELSQLRAIELEDLLGREEVVLDQSSLGAMITDKVIMVTGAGGSIGSELCNQICKFKPATLVCFEMGEYNLYQLEMNLKEKFPHVNLIPVIGDVRNKDKVDYIIGHYKPFTIFHAAAYKHVPMMEANPYEAVQTNILGTKIVAEAASAHKVSRFVLISTDKAVNPTNIMGATKRAAEIVTQLTQSKTKKTKFMMVRFGNVLGSSGSVIPLFRKQIARGGPLTVTHPEIKRYFMSIPEACRLVLQAGAIGNGGEIFVLDMGEPVKIVDLAKQMIKLSGLKEGKDIQIEFSGLRPGEKMFEELFLDDEHTLSTIHPLIRVAKPINSSIQNMDDIDALLMLHAESNRDHILSRITIVVPELIHTASINLNCNPAQNLQ
jgi:FlaA1/EpsC-like NDP-sugar epimerase